MHVTIVHAALTEKSSVDDLDVLAQAEAVTNALNILGHEVSVATCDVDLSDIQRRLRRLRPDLVFNLVETISGHGRLIHLFPALLDVLSIPYTGSSTETLWMTSHKIIAKDRMSAAGLPTPPWIGPYPKTYPSFFGPKPDHKDCRPIAWIVKSLWEHASVGLDENRIIRGKTAEQIREILQVSASELGGACFAEMFIDGREFNIALMDGPKGPFVLPAAEINFEGYEHQPKIVCYRAKWEAESWEYSHTVRCFDVPAKDESLIKQLSDMSLDCWRLFGITGYARVDFRVDPEGKPTILEVNANPCLSPDAGFAAAAEHLGIPYSEMVQCILNAAMVR